MIEQIQPPHTQLAAPAHASRWHDSDNLGSATTSAAALFPELTAHLDTLERLGVPIALMQPKPLGDQVPGPVKPFLLRTARTRVRR